MTEKRAIRVEVNGIQRQEDVEPRLLLADFLRENLGLTGTHLGCEHGVCGACTVLMDGKPVRSCTAFAVQADETRITTVEGLSADGELTPLAQAFRDHYGLQCGFCTPGFLVTATALLTENPHSGRDQDVTGRQSLPVHRLLNHRRRRGGGKWRSATGATCCREWACWCRSDLLHLYGSCRRVICGRGND